MRPIVLEELKTEIENSSKTTEIYVGADSRRFKKWSHTEKKVVWYASYTRVVIIHTDGNKGCAVYGDNKVERDYGNIRMRMMNEVVYSTEIAAEIAEAVGDRVFELHIDINPKPEHKSNVALKEAIGYVRGMLGITPKFKPESTGAAHTADRWA